MIYSLILVVSVVFTMTADKEVFGGVLFFSQTSQFQDVLSFRHRYTYHLPWKMLVIILKQN